jgi:hypothetical protein
MRLKVFLSFMKTVLFAVIAGFIGFIAGFNPVVSGIVFFVAYTLYFSFFPAIEGALAGVNKEIWIDKLKEGFYSGFEWLSRVDDLSTWVEFNTINFTIAGTDPVILKNNVTWPIVAAQRTDTNGTVVLDTYDSTTSRVRNVEEIEAAIDKLESVVKQHRNALMQEIVTECLWNYAPATGAAGAFAATGANRAAVIGAQTTVASTLTLQDVASIQERWDVLRLPQEGRTLVLSPYHRRDLMAQDITLFKAFTDLKKGQALPLFGIDVYVADNTPLYTKTTLAKKAYGAAADNTNDCIASVAFIAGEVMKCEGDMEMFFKPKDINPEQRADEVGFQMRFKGIPYRTTANYQQAIVSNRA